MKIRIAVFGLESSIARIQEFAKSKEHLQIFTYVYKTAKESKRLLAEAKMCDVYLFTGPLPYLYAQDEIKQSNIEAVYVQFDEFMISSSFYRLRNKLGKDLNRISIDSIHEEYVNQVLNEFELLDKDIYMYSFGDGQNFDIEHIIAFHIDLWEKGKIDYVLTTIGEVEKRLNELGLPCWRMIIPKTNLGKALNEASDKGRLRISENSQIAVGFVKIKDFESIISKNGDFFAEGLLLKLHQTLLNFGHKMYASTLNTGNNKFVIFGTKGILDDITNGYQDLPLIREIEHKINISITIGFGLGLTAKQAEEHAKIALSQGEELEESSCFIVNEKKEYIGPLGNISNVIDSNIYRLLTEFADLNDSTASKLIEFLSIRHNKMFSAQDIAEYFNIAKRSAERIIKQLLDKKVIAVVGEEKFYRQGRPRKIYEMIQGVKK